MSSPGAPPDTASFNSFDGGPDNRYPANFAPMSSGGLFESNTVDPNLADISKMTGVLNQMDPIVQPQPPQPAAVQPTRSLFDPTPIEQQPQFDGYRRQWNSSSVPQDRQEVAAYIAEAAQQRGIDPETALRVFKQESGFNPAARNVNAKEESYGVAQLNVKGGLGAVARKAGIEPSDPAQWRQQIDFSLDTVAKDGWRQWYGARDVGISRWQGIGRRADADIPENATFTSDPASELAALMPQQDEGDIFQDFGVSPDEYEHDLATGTIRRKVLPSEPDSTMLPEIVVTPEPYVEPPLGAYDIANSPPELTGEFESNKGEPQKSFIEGLIESGKATPEPSFIDTLTRGVRQTGKGVIAAPGNILFGGGAAVAALSELPGALMNDPVPDDRSAYTMFRELMDANNRGASQLMGLSSDPKPRNVVEELAKIGGEALMPAGKLTLPLTGIATGVTYLSNLLTAPAEAAKKPAPKDAFAGLVEKGNVDLSKLATEINGAVIPMPDGTFVVIPQSSLYGRLNLPYDKAIEQYKRTGVNLGRFQTAADASAFIEAVNDRVRATVNTVAGPKQVRTSELALMGALGAFSIGAMFAPQIFSKFSRTTPRLGRPVSDAAPGTEAFSRRSDLAHTYTHDVNAAPIRIAESFIRDPVTLKRVQDSFMMQTRGAASNIADSAVRNGIADSANFSFKVKVPLAELQARTTPQREQYLNLRDTFDDINALSIKQANQIRQRISVPPGPPTVRGMTEADVLQQIGALERADPTLRQIGAAYRENLKNFRRFVSTGEYSTISGKEARRLNANNPNEVPFVGSARVWDDPTVRRQSPFIALGEKMRTGMRFRMENEAKGVLIDAMRKDAPSSFVRVSPRQLADNPHWEKNTVTMYRRGQKEMYSTDPLLADTLRMDPYFFQNRALDIMYRTKRAAESTTTGLFAPWFAETSFLRNHQIAKPTAPTIPGMSAPNILQSIAAIPAQLGPQAAQAIAQRLNTASAGWVGQVFGPQYLQSLSNRLTTVYRDSLFARLEAAGSHRGSILEHQIRDPNAIHWQRLSQTNIPILDAAINKTTGATRTFIEGWKATFGAIHNAPSYAFARRNQGNATLPELALMSRQLTGDPMSGGQLTNAGRTIRFQDDSRVGALATKGVQALGVTSEIGRLAIPWFNPSMQGMKRIGQAYVNDPKRFVTNAWIYTQLPAATAYAWNRSAGVDPQGQSYSDYHMNGRSQYNTMMNYYIAIPGRPAAEGIQLPRFHELAPMARWMEIAMDHAFASSKYSQSEDFANVAANGVKVVFGPSMPPLGNVAFASQGMVGPQGVFEGEGYKRKDQPFDQNAGLPANIELYMRAIAPGLADVFGAGAAAAIQADEGRWRIGAFAEEAGKRAISKGPISRNLFDIKPPATGNTRYTEELFAKQRSINQLEQFYKKWDIVGGDSSINTDVSSKPRSIAGSLVAEQTLGKPIPSQIPGLGQPEPTNPLYKMFAEELHNAFKRDDPANGGIAFQSIWRRYSNATEALKTLQKVNAGNFVSWQRQLEARPEAMAFLQENNVNTKSPIAVKNFYETYRQDAAKELLFAIRKTEQEFSKRLGKPIKLENLDPYGRGLSEDTSMTFDFGEQSSVGAY